MPASPSAAAPSRAINFAHKLGLIAEHWQPRVIAELNDYQFKLVKILGDFILHTHAHTDEAFLVLQDGCGSTSSIATCSSTPANCTWCPGASRTARPRWKRSACC